MRLAPEHVQVLKTLCEHGNISRHAMKSIRGQVLQLKTFQEREAYLKKVIRGSVGV